jgi:hypothetical protein
VKQIRSGIPHTARRMAQMVFLSAATGVVSPVQAIGLGQPVSNPVVGQPLKLEIPLLLEQGEAAPAAACVRLAQSEQGSDPQFFPRNARVTVLSGSRPHVRIVSSEAVTEPMLEFRLMLGCDTIIARDFLLLADRSDALPASAPTPPATKRARSDISVETAPASPRRSILLPPAPIEGQRLLLPTATSLNLIARQLFPDNRERRDEYRRQIAKANPTLFSRATHVGAVHLPAGTSLLMPTAATMPADELPVAPQTRRATGLVKVAAVPDAPAIAAATPRAAKPDHLVVGVAGAPEIRSPLAMTPRQISGAIERIERMVEDQGRTEVQLVGGLDTVNAAFVEMKDFLQVLDTDQRQLQRAHKALERRVADLPEPKSIGTLELLALILAAGGVGAALIMLSHRMQLRRLAALPAQEAVPAASSRVVAKPSLSFV